jgi:hypothetical protein
VRLYHVEAGVTIYHGDCREVLPHVDADVLLTDPPYGIAYRSSHEAASPGIVGDDDASLRDEVLAAWGDRPALVFGTWRRSAPAGAHTCLVWDKGLHVGMGNLSIPWKPNWEAIYVSGSGFIGRRDPAVLSIPAPPSWTSRAGNVRGRTRLHAHQKPVTLISALLSKCPPAWRVLDPFMGSGSTLVAAKVRGRQAVGIEIEERYCEVAARRLAQGVMFTDPEAA